MPTIWAETSNLTYGIVFLAEVLKVRFAAIHEFNLIRTVPDPARESCPVLPGAVRQIHQRFENPDRPGLADETLLPMFRRTWDEIGEYCRALLAAEVGGTGKGE